QKMILPWLDLAERCCRTGRCIRNPCRAAGLTLEADGLQMGSPPSFPPLDSLWGSTSGSRLEVQGVQQPRCWVGSVPTAFGAMGTELEHKRARNALPPRLTPNLAPAH
uniref:Uncharacterized protein n=1 Tax=Phasianus colchicus TaxID=9054 RepID=A0A669QCQ7_PHACC